MSRTRVRFIDSEERATLLVRTSRRGGLITPLVRMLSRLGLEVHHLESKLRNGEHLERLVVAEPYGRALDAPRLAHLRAEVLSTIEEARLATERGPDSAAA